MYDAAVYDVIGTGGCVGANGDVFGSFWKSGLADAECSDFCTREPTCGGYYHMTNADGYCHVLGPGLAQPVGWNIQTGNGGVWPISGVAGGVGATCYRKIATTTGNIR